MWDDTFVRYHEPHIGMAAVNVLDAAGYDVTLPHRRKCCGRPAFSLGHLDEAAALGRHNLALLQADDADAPIVFLEPSCYSMFVEDYRELNLPGAERSRARCFLFEQFIDDLLAAEPDALKFKPEPAHVTIHAHCHAKALADPASRQPGRAPARPQRHPAGHRLLRHGRRLWRDGRQIRTLPEDRRPAHGPNPAPAFWPHRGRLRHQLPPSNPRTSPPSAPCTWPKSSPKPWSSRQGGTGILPVSSIWPKPSPKPSIDPITHSEPNAGRQQALIQ